MRYFCFLLYFLGFYPLYAQVHVAYYEHKWVLDLEGVDNEFLREICTSAKEYEDDVKVRLLFDNQYAISMVDESLMNSENVYAFAACNCKEPTYFDKENNVIEFPNQDLSALVGIGRGEYLLTEVLFRDWELLAESKQINGFTAYKARVKQLDGKNRPDAIAWYVPELPYPYGPTHFGGLPGLIVQLSDGANMFTLLKIEFDTDLKIEQPEPAEKMDAREFYRMVREMQTKDL